VFPYVSPEPVFGERIVLNGISVRQKNVCAPKKRRFPHLLKAVADRLDHRVSSGLQALYCAPF
jgi:hypothetical protein